MNIVKHLLAVIIPGAGPGLNSGSKVMIHRATLTPPATARVEAAGDLPLPPGEDGRQDGYWDARVSFLENRTLRK